MSRPSNSKSQKIGYLKCLTCKNEYPMDKSYFRKSKAYSHGYRPQCKKCLVILDKDKRNRNKESIKKSHQKWNESNKDYYKNYYQQNKDYMLERSSKRWTERYRTEPEFKLKALFRRRFSYFLNGRITDNIKNYIGCSIEELRKHLENNFADGMSWENHGEWHIDHIIPVSSFDYSPGKIEESLHKCWHYSNLQPLWASDNLKKSNKH